MSKTIEKVKNPQPRSASLVKHDRDKCVRGVRLTRRPSSAKSIYVFDAYSSWMSPTLLQALPDLTLGLVAPDPRCSKIIASCCSGFLKPEKAIMPIYTFTYFSTASPCLHLSIPTSWPVPMPATPGTTAQGTEPLCENLKASTKETSTEHSKRPEKCEKPKQPKTYRGKCEKKQKKSTFEAAKPGK